MACNVSRMIAIVGAGPAGAFAALTLARRGARVRLFDASHPREKPCGGGITERALHLVADAIELPRLPATTIRRVRFESSPTGTSALVALDAPGIVVSSRQAFDAALLAAARAAGVSHVDAR